MQLVGAQHLRIGVERPGLLAAPRQFRRRRGQIAVEGLLQLIHQPIDLGGRRITLQRVGQGLARLLELPLGQRHIALLDAQRRLPQQVAHRA